MPTFPSFHLELQQLPLRYEWKLSRNTSTEKINGIIRATGSGHTGLGEVAPNIRYGESPESVQAEFKSCLPIISAFQEEGKTWPEILRMLPACQALKTGLDMAMANWNAACAGKKLHAFFSLPAPRIREICYTIPVMDPGEIEHFIRKEHLKRFSWLKLKVNEPLASDILKKALEHFQGKIAIDGNEAWKDMDRLLRFIESLPVGRILFLEQPLPSDMREAYPVLKKQSGIEIWGDESVLGEAEPDYWKKAFSGVNIKLMKTGGIENAIDMLQKAKQSGLKTMIGCMVETSIGISAAMQLESLADFMDLDGFLLPVREPFGLVKEQDGKVQLTA